MPAKMLKNIVKKNNMRSNPQAVLMLILPLGKGLSGRFILSISKSAISLWALAKATKNNMPRERKSTS
jgi:hypothetical protein